MRNSQVPVVEFTIKGQPGDRYFYEITKKDGTVVRATTDEFSPPQREVFIHTSVRNEDVAVVAIKASGPVGSPGDCVITTIR